MKHFNDLHLHTQVAHSFREMLTLILWCPQGQAHIRQVASYITETPERSCHIDSTSATHAGLLQSELRPGDRLSYFFFFSWLSLVFPKIAVVP